MSDKYDNDNIERTDTEVDSARQDLLDFNRPTELGPAPEITEEQATVTVEENRRALALQVAVKFSENMGDLLTNAKQCEEYLAGATMNYVD